MGFFASRKNEKVQIAAHDNSSLDTVINDGTLEYTTDVGGNGAAPTTQEASGAPVETTSPLGYEVTWITVIFLKYVLSPFETRRSPDPPMSIS